MSKPRIGVIGSGQVAQALAKGFQKHGYPVHLGTRDPKKFAEITALTGIEAYDFKTAAAKADQVLIAVKGTSGEEVVRSLKAELADKVVIDAMNPIADVPPQDGVLVYFTDGSQSLMERLQAIAPAARFVKAFNSVGNAFMVDPSFPGGKPTMFIAGNDPAAKAAVEAILLDFGWKVEDMGLAASARPIESLCQLWCAPGLLRNEWNHAFALLKG
jgi:predicted dinucleotide-binding enzyme